MADNQSDIETMAPGSNRDKTIQSIFDRDYITSSEICETMGVARSSIVYARRVKILPEPIKVKGTRAFLWHRKTTELYLNAWRMQLDRKSKHLNSAKCTA
ncbi:MAG: hypothetical protein OEY89_16310 [Gammaproteobacteria bacterium]|nr:hypothetical protein [Gammaproteobacteria bacterium]